MHNPTNEANLESELEITSSIASSRPESPPHQNDSEMSDLVQALAKMKSINNTYVQEMLLFRNLDAISRDKVGKPTDPVTSKRLIEPIHRYCAASLRRHGVTIEISPSSVADAPLPALLEEAISGSNRQALKALAQANLQNSLGLHLSRALNVRRINDLANQVFDTLVHDSNVSISISNKKKIVSQVANQIFTAFADGLSNRIAKDLATATARELRDAVTDNLRDLRTGRIQELLNKECNKEFSVYGAYIRKNVDICAHTENSGPLIAISVKSMMSSISKNSINRFEEYVGDATNLHTRYPMLVFGFLIVIPVLVKGRNSGLAQLPKGNSDRESEEFTFEVEGDVLRPTQVARKIERMLSGVNERATITSPSGSYEAACLVAADFSCDPPKILEDFPAKDSNLRVEDFFEKVVELFNKRNPELASDSTELDGVS